MWVFAGCIVTQLSALVVLFLTVHINIGEEEISRKNVPIIENLGSDLNETMRTIKDLPSDLDKNRSNKTLTELADVVKSLGSTYDWTAEQKDEILKNLKAAIEEVIGSYTVYHFIVEPILKFHNSLMLTVTVYALVYCGLLSMLLIYGLIMSNEILIDKYMMTSYYIVGFISLFVTIQLISHPSPYQAGTIVVISLHGVFLWLARIRTDNMKRRNQIRSQSLARLLEERSFVTDEIII